MLAGQLRRLGTQSAIYGAGGIVSRLVAVALLPPAATLGVMLATQRWELALGAGMLLAANVACVNLAAQIVFTAKGIRPRTWYERKGARRAVLVNMVTWITLICILIALVALRTAAGQ